MNDRNLKNGTGARPHPGPLPPAFALSYGSAGQERGNAAKATQAFEFSRILRNLPLSSGEREKRWQRLRNRTPLGDGVVCGLISGFYDRPHPSPLPQERGNAAKATQTFELSSNVRNLSLSPGERVGVRAGLPLTLPRVHHTPSANVLLSFELSSSVRKLALTLTLSPEREKRWQCLWNTTCLSSGAVFGLISGFEARPHPSPLPQERGNATKATKTFELSGNVWNLSLSPGERVGVRAGLPLTFCGADYSGASISGQGVWRPLLQRFENRIADSLALAPQSRVPKTQFLDSKSLEEPGSFCVIGLSSRKPVLEPVELNREPRLLAEKVQEIFPLGMLASKFVAGEPPVPQPSPHEFLCPGSLLPERTGESGVGHGGEPRTLARDFKNGTKARPHPQKRGNATKATKAFELSGTVWKPALTPTLSPGEREKRWQCSRNTLYVGGGVVSGLISGFYDRPLPSPLPQERGTAAKATKTFELSGTVWKPALTPALSPGERGNCWQCSRNTLYVGRGEGGLPSDFSTGLRRPEGEPSFGFTKHLKQT
jgi:hypothetical protein